MSRIPHAIYAVQGWERAQETIRTSFWLRRQGVLSERSTVAFLAMSGGAFVVKTDEDALIKSEVGGLVEQRRLPSECAGRLVLANHAAFDETETHPDVIYLRGGNIPPTLAIGIGEEAIRGSEYKRPADIAALPNDALLNFELVNGLFTPE